MIFGNITTPIDFFAHAEVSAAQMSNMLAAWNPSNDPVIDEFAMLILNLQRELHARRGRFKKGYWDKLPIPDQYLAEAEADWLERTIQDMYVACRAYCLSLIEPVETDFDDKGFILAIGTGTASAKHVSREIHAYYERVGHKENAFLDSDIMRRIAEYDACISLIPGDTPLAQHESTLMRIRPNEDTDRFELYATPGPREVAHLEFYRNYIGPIRGEFIESLSNTLADCQAASITGNQDKSKKAVPPMILFDHDIPTPRKVSFWGWFQACGVVFRRLTDRERILIRSWFQGAPEYVITYIPPFMPRTHEHMTGGQVVTGNAGDADWSLPGRSKFHVRTPEGFIDYGFWTARTSILGRNGEGDGATGAMRSVPVLNQDFDSMDMSRMALHESALDTLRLESTIHKWVIGDFSHTVGFEKLNRQQARGMSNGLIRPDVGGQTQAFNMFGIGDDPTIMPMASIASVWDVHFRFGNKEALLSWSMAFEEMAYWFAEQSTPMARRALYMHEIQHRLYNIRNPGKFSHFNKGGVNTVFDLKGL